MAIKNGMKRKLKRQRRTTSTLLTFIALLLLVVTYDLRDGRSGAAVEALDTEAIKECVASDGACASSAATDEETTSIDCIDKHDDCSNWGRDGECDFNPKYMLKDCPRACNACQFDAHNMDKEITRRTRVVNAGGDERCLETPFGISQTINDEGMDAGDVIQLFRKLSTYMEETVLVDHEYETVRDRCKNKSRQCAEWKLNGECETVSCMVLYGCVCLFVAVALFVSIFCRHLANKLPQFDNIRSTHRFLQILESLMDECQLFSIL
jgi:hypothetical protein